MVLKRDLAIDVFIPFNNRQGRFGLQDAVEGLESALFWGATHGERHFNIRGLLKAAGEVVMVLLRVIVLVLSDLTRYMLITIHGLVLVEQLTILLIV